MQKLSWGIFLRTTLGVCSGFVLAFALFGWGGGGVAFWKDSESPSIEEREHVRSIIEEVIVDQAATDGVHRPSVAEWDALCKGMAVVDGDMGLLDVQVDGQGIEWLARGMAEIFKNLDAFGEGKDIPQYTPAMFCEDMESKRKPPPSA